MQENLKVNISNRYSDAMCCGCGICAGICPTNAISMKINKQGVYFPVVTKERCIQCEKCLKVCPGIDVDYERINDAVTSEKRIKDSYIGQHLNCYKGFSSDKQLRHDCSSGGVTTALLCDLLEREKVDAVVVVKYNINEKIRTNSFLARTKEEVVEARGSKYAPVSLENVLKEIKKKDEKVVFVCLPCHAIGLRKAMIQDPILQERIFFIFTLFCGVCPSYNAIDFFLHKSKISSKDIQTFSNRGNGWPGKTSLQTKNSLFVDYDFPAIWSDLFGSGFFTPLSCFCCYDFFGEFSDISFGDAWLKECRGDKEGVSVFIARTQKGEQILKEAFERGIISIECVDQDKLKKAFRLNLLMKKDHYVIHKKIVKDCPDIKNIELCVKNNIFSYAYEYFRLSKIIVGHNPFLLGLLLNKENILSKIYNRIGNVFLKILNKEKNNTSYFL